MANYLVYWKTYWEDMDGYSYPTCDWHTRSKPFYDAIRKGDTIWVVTSGNGDHSNEWRLLETIVVTGAEKSQDPKRLRQYRFAGNKKSSLLFDVKKQPDFTAILWMVKFRSGKQIKTLNNKIGQALQGFRTLSEGDAILLRDYAKTLKIRRIAR